ncbi:MAG TPA: amidohydrolase family protein [Thermoanaerobaculia bacterium]|nr:amidohydrolase family protein [Thermoanaerobaculia bacterium]
MRIGRLALFTLFALACAHQPPAPREQTLRYTVLMSTNTAGTQLVTTRGDEITVDYEYNDRGRGPKTHSVIRLDDRGLPVSMTIAGNDYFKQDIEERFSFEKGKASWKNTAENGEAVSQGYYASMYGPPEELAVLARALLRNGGRMALLPGGEASIRKVGEASVRGTHVTAYEISGLGFTPFEVWLDDDRHLFGFVSAWQSTIREGFEAYAKQLIEAQDARATTRIAELTRKLTKRPTMGRLTVMNARIFDPRSGTLSAPTSIHVEGNRIAKIGGEQERNAADIMDAAGKVVLPGLWDMHTHLGDMDGLLNIAAGITSVRDLGNDSDTIVAFRRNVDEGRWVGPRISLAGLVDGPGPFKGPTNILAGNEEEARKAVDFFAGRGYEGLKIYSSIKPELVPVLTRYAHERGLRVSGHIPAGMRATEAVDAGYDEIQHANMLFLNFMPDVTDTRTPARFTEVGKRAADLDLQSEEVRAFIAKLRDRKIVVDPTVAIFENMFTARAGTMAEGYAMVADRFPPQVRRQYLSGGLPVPEGMDEKYRASFRRMLDLVAELHRGGVTIVAGTDALPGFSLHRELELYAQAGIPNADVLRIATLTAAQVLKRDGDLGTIEPGKLADFIIVDGDPTQNMSDIRRIVTVVKDGLVFDPNALYGEVGVRP